MSANKLSEETAKAKVSPRKKVSDPNKKEPAPEKQIKYSDKSEGQPELVVIFKAIKALMEPYATGTIKEQGGTGGMYTLVSKKPVEVEGRKKDEIYFAGLLVQKGYVGFYYMPVYVESELKEIFKPELLKCLKGKSCFHIRKNDPQIMEQISYALKKGYEVYKEKGWV